MFRSCLDYATAAYYHSILIPKLIDILWKRRIVYILSNIYVKSYVFFCVENLQCIFPLYCNEYNQATISKQPLIERVLKTDKLGLYYSIPSSFCNEISIFKVCHGNWQKVYKCEETSFGILFMRVESVST